MARVLAVRRVHDSDCDDGDGDSKIFTRESGLLHSDKKRAVLRGQEIEQ